MNNDERVEYAAHALDMYGLKKEGRPDYDDPSTQASDLICDLLHLITAHGDDAKEKLAIAVSHFELEQAEVSMVNILLLTAVALSAIFFLWGVDNALDARMVPPIYVTAPQPAFVWRDSNSAALASVYGLTPKEVDEPITIYGKDTK